MCGGPPGRSHGGKAPARLSPGRWHLHAAVGEGQAVCITGQALLLTVIGTGGWGESIARVDIVGVDRLPPGSIPVKKEGTLAVAQQYAVTLIMFSDSSGYPNNMDYECKEFRKKSRNGWHLHPASLLLLCPEGLVKPMASPRPVLCISANE